MWIKMRPWNSLFNVGKFLCQRLSISGTSLVIILKDFIRPVLKCLKIFRRNSQKKKLEQIAKDAGIRSKRNRWRILCVFCLILFRGNCVECCFIRHLKDCVIFHEMSVWYYLLLWFFVSHTVYVLFWCCWFWPRVRHLCLQVDSMIRILVIKEILILTLKKFYWTNWE